MPCTGGVPCFVVVKHDKIFQEKERSQKCVRLKLVQGRLKQAQSRRDWCFSCECVRSVPWCICPSFSPARGSFRCKRGAVIWPHDTASSRFVKIDTRWRLRREKEGKMDRGPREEERAAGLTDVPGAHSEKAPQIHIINNASPSPPTHAHTQRKY